MSCRSARRHPCRQEALDTEILRVQRARFEARARGDENKKLDALDDAFKQVRALRVQNLQRLQGLGPGD